MGLDARVWARDESDAQWTELTERLWALGHAVELTKRSAWLDEGDEATPVVMWSDGSRYWGPGYERGPWLLIAGVIEAFRSVYREVRYHSDSIDESDARPITDDDMAELWAHWRSPHWNDYHLPRPLRSA